MTMRNTFHLLGRLVTDVDLSYTPSAHLVAVLTLRTEETLALPNQSVMAIEWHRVLAWGHLAEACYALTINDILEITGHLTTVRMHECHRPPTYGTYLIAQAITVIGHDDAPINLDDYPGIPTWPFDDQGADLFLKPDTPDIRTLLYLYHDP